MLDGEASGRVDLLEEILGGRPWGEPELWAMPIEYNAAASVWVSDTVDVLSRQLHRFFGFGAARDGSLGHHSSLALPKSIPAESARRSPIFVTASPTRRTTLSNAKIGSTPAIPSSASAAFESELLR